MELTLDPQVLFDTKDKSKYGSAEGTTSCN